jgi:hypothetical protein
VTVATIGLSPGGRAGAVDAYDDIGRCGIGHSGRELSVILRLCLGVRVAEQV